MEEFILKWVPLGLSILAIVGNIYVYLKHNKRLNEQQKMLNEQQKAINDYQLRKIAKEEENERKASMCMDITRNGNGEREVVFYNSGKADARNVIVKLLSDSNFAALNFDDKNKQWGPYDVINPQSKRKDEITVFIGSPDIIQVEITWDDDFASGRKAFLTQDL
jgi:hypothetical protein